MAAIRVCAKLDFINGEEFHRPIQRHRFHRAGEILRLGRDDFFLAGDQGNIAFALHRHHAIIIFTRQQPQRKADTARGMGEHPLNREVGLAGIGRAKNGANPGFEHAGVNVQERKRDAPWHDAARLSMVAATGRVARP